MKYVSKHILQYILLQAILPSVKGKASGFIDLTGLMMQERLSDDAAVRYLWQEAVEALPAAVP